MAPLFLLFLITYVFSAGAHLYSVDELSSYFTTRAIAERGSLNIAYAIPLFHELGFLEWVPENVSTYYSAYGVLHASLAVPLYFLGTWLGVVQWKIIGLLYSPVISAASGCLVYAISRRLAHSRRMSVALSLLYCFATIAWPYAKFFFDVTTASAMQLASVYFLLDATANRRSTLLSGSFAALSVLARVTQILILPPMIIYVVFKTRGRLSAKLATIGAFMIPLITGAVLYGYLNSLRLQLSSPLGLLSYFAASLPPFRLSQLLVGTYGMLLSSGPGLFIYTPLCALGLFSLLFSDRWHNWEGFILFSFFFSNLIFSSLLPFWSGWIAWGPRYLVTSVPYLILPLAPILHSIKTSITRTMVLVCATAVGIFSNLMGVLINFLYDFGYLYDIGAVGFRSPNPIPPETWIPSFSPLRASWDLIWSEKFPACYYPYVPEVFYLKARYDLYLYDTYGLYALVFFCAIVLLASSWLVVTVRRNVPD